MTQQRFVVFTPGQWHNVQQTLFAQPGHEGFAFALARPSQVERVTLRPTFWRLDMPMALGKCYGVNGLALEC